MRRSTTLLATIRHIHQKIITAIAETIIDSRATISKQNAKMNANSSSSNGNGNGEDVKSLRDAAGLDTPIGETRMQLRSHSKRLLRSNNVDFDNDINDKLSQTVEPPVKAEGNRKVESQRASAKRRRTGKISYENEDSIGSPSSPNAELVSIKVEDAANVNIKNESNLPQSPTVSPYFQQNVKQEVEEAAETITTTPNEPLNWRNVYEAILEMRKDRNAPVDTQGCERLANSQDPKTYRYQTLISLMLSSQTKDQVTAEAMSRLGALWSDGLTIANVRAATPSMIHSAIASVSFHRRKLDYIQRTTNILHEKYNDDVPGSIEALCDLPGVGPKMAFLCMQVGWKQNVGIGVDVHVHRISNRLGWTWVYNDGKPTKTPEQTRVALQSWLPKPLWAEVNYILVGFGQQLCTSLRPKCEGCKANKWCPEGQSNLQRISKGLKPLIVTKAKMMSKGRSKTA